MKISLSEYNCSDENVQEILVHICEMTILSKFRYVWKIPIQNVNFQGFGEIHVLPTVGGSKEIPALGHVSANTYGHKWVCTCPKCLPQRSPMRFVSCRCSSGRTCPRRRRVHYSTDRRTACSKVPHTLRPLGLVGLLRRVGPLGLCLLNLPRH